MFTVTIFEKSKKILRTYQHINKITYSNLIDDVVLEGDSILSHEFDLCCTLHLFSDTGNYTIDAKVIGTLEIDKEG